MTKNQFIYALTACGCLLKDGKTWYEHNELIKCFEDLGLFEQEPQTFKWCTDCKEYDQEKHCCHRWSKVIRDTVEEMKQEQEPFINKPCVSSGVCEHDKQNVLDKIRAEIEEKYGNYDICEWFEDYDYEENDISGYHQVGDVSDILAIIDKYRVESEDKE